MNKSAPLILREEAILPLGILAVIISVVAGVLSCFSVVSYAASFLSYLVSIPAIFLAVLVLVQKPGQKISALSVISLVCIKIAWIIVSMVFIYKMYLEIYTYIGSATNLKIF